MITRAIAKYIRIAPRKARQVIDLVRGLPVIKAEAKLGVIEKKASLYIMRLIHSAVDSAEKRFKIPAGELYISAIKADQGPMLKRFRAASMGRASSIAHRTTHVTLELDRIKRYEKKIVETPKQVEKQVKKEPVVKKPKIKKSKSDKE